MFNASQIPALYHPTCVMLIDDSETFLMSLSLGLDEDIPCLTRSNPRAALEELKSRLFQPSFTSLESLLANPNRFNEVGVAVVDKSMPAIDGLELCAQLDHSRIKTILLTGVADVTPALHALQTGIIDAYINKGELSALHKLNHTIKEFSANLLMTAYEDRLVG
ncbi:MAG TPA: response regulator, partial [Coxiellaceae bacterium]|nr:response regulator [Coxiellaceae bacterium]